MAYFLYKARDKSGKLISATVEAQSEDEVVSLLREQGALPLSVQKTTKKLKIPKKKGKISIIEINIFTRQFAALVRAGIPFLASLSAVRDQMLTGEFRDVLTDIMGEIEKGEFFSDALQKHDNVFGKIYISMVRNAEVGGMLPEMLGRLVELGEKELEIRNRIKAAMSYPVMVLAMLGIAFFVLVTFIVPRFEKIFSQFKSELPLLTKILIGTNHFITSYWYIVVALIGLMVYLIRRFLSKRTGLLWWDEHKLKIPVVGDLMGKISFSRFARVVSVLTATGVPLVKVLNLARDSVDNSYLEAVINDMTEEVIGGTRLSAAMKKTKVFPPLVVQMITSGEDIGKLDELLGFVSEYYDEEVQYSLKKMISYIEPALIVVLAAAVLFIALAIFLPMWDMMKLFKR